ncbi:MAG TPA: ECF-type sigma factor [Pirellulaceae bacterium]|nr:ECF-type sigma factor [Pirellulaceae bacterium]
MSDVTHILSQIESGDPQASAELLPIVYEELRRLAKARMANERADHTLQSTALVHEAYVRLVDTDEAKHWDSRGHFFAAAAEAMRRILIESARGKHSQKRGDHLHRISAEGLDFAASTNCDPDLLLDIDAGVNRLAEEDAEAAELVKLRLFAGLTVTEAGEMLGMSRTSAYRTWEFVRSWFAVNYAGGADL